MSVQNHFSERDPRVIDAVENQYLYGRTKDTLKNLEKDIIEITKDITRSIRLEIDFPDRLSEVELITVALSQLRKKHFSEDDSKELKVFKKRIHLAINALTDILDTYDISGYRDAMSRLLGAMYSINPLGLDNSVKSDIGIQQDTVAVKVLDGVLGAINIVENAGDRWKEKREKAAAKKPKAG